MKSQKFITEKKLFLLGFLIFSFVISTSSFSYAGCASGYYCFGTTVFTRYMGCENDCVTQKTSYSSISCDASCSYLTEGLKCGCQAGKPCWTDTNGCMVSAYEHSGNCCAQESCSCDSSWTNDSCGGGSCASNKMRQTRDCNPDGCDTESQCVDDSSCEDNTSPTCGTWSPDPSPWKSSGTQSFTLSESTDTGGSGINVSGGSCTTGSSHGDTCTVTISDIAGNTTNCTSPINRVDSVAPSVYASNASSSWFNYQQTATVSASDSGGSGLAQVRYSWGSNFLNSSCNDTSGGTVTSDGATLNAPSGGTTLYLCARDTAGNVGTWSGTYRWDNIGPSVTFSPDSASWTNQSVSVSIGISDSGGSGLKQWRYRLSSDDGSSYGTWSSWSTSSGGILTLTSQGQWKIQVEAEDNATNLTTATSGTYGIDKTGPSVTFNPNSASWTNQSVSVSIGIGDSGGSGLKQWRYRLSSDDGSSYGTWSSWSTSSGGILTLTSQGQWKIQVEAEDNATNLTTATSGTYRIDKTGPSVSASNSSSSWFDSLRTATVSASDSGGSGLAQVRYNWGSNFLNSSCNDTSGGTVTSDGATLNAPSGGTTLYLCARNNAGNVGTWSGTYRWETMDPSVTFNPNSASWTNQSVSVSIGISDSGGSGLKQWRYRLSSNNGSSYGTWSSWYTSSGVTLTLTSQGQWKIQVEAEDNATNLTTATSGTYRIDKTGPSVSASNSSSSWFDSLRTATVSASDSGGSGLAQVRYNWGSNAMNSTCSSGGTVTSNGATLNAPSGGTTLYLCARDNAWNVRTWSGTYRWCTSTPLGNPEKIALRYLQNGIPVLTINDLSTDSSKPTVIRKLHDEQTGETYIPQFLSVPSCASDYGYKYSGSGGSAEYSHPNYIHEVNPKSALTTEGFEGSITGAYYTISKAGTKIYSPNPRTGYYKINHNPDFGCPTIVNDFDDTSRTKGCSTTTYTGIKANNPLKFEIIGSDLDGVDEIKGAIVWLSKNGTTGSIPDFPSISGTYTKSDPNQIAVMVIQRDGSWDNSPLLYTSDSTNGYNWANITSHGEIRTDDGVVMARVTEASGTPNEENVIFNIQIEFTIPELGQSSYPEGNYEISGLVFDKYMLIASGAVVDQFDMSTDCSEGGWNIDLRRPTFEPDYPSTKNKFANDLELFWNFNGTGSYATDAVINGYSDLATEEIILESPEGYSNITPTSLPSDDNIGVLTDPNAWHLENSQVSETYNSYVSISIGTNVKGTIIFYVTGFDQACNTTNKSVTINFNPWIASKGGFVYSGGNVGANAKDYSTNEEYSAFIDSVLRKVTAEELDIGTEVVTSRSGTINDFIHPKLSAVRASNVYNSNSQMSSWYEYFSDRLNEQMANTDSKNFKEFQFPEDGIILNNRISDYCDASEEEYCYMNIQDDLNVVPAYIYNVFPSGERRKELICDKKTLIMASGDIHIEPDIINGGDDNINGCIFIAGGSITVGAGDWVSQNATELEDTRYDYLDAFLVADKIIDIQLVDLKEPEEGGSVIYTRDGLELYGGLVAFGQNIPTGTSAVQTNRSFGLWNAYIPVTAITWDPRYAKLAEAFFGPTVAMYKREVGFKPY